MPDFGRDIGDEAPNLLEYGAEIHGVHVIQKWSQERDGFYTTEQAIAEYLGWLRAVHGYQAGEMGQQARD